MNNKYTLPDTNPQMANESVSDYSTGTIIPIHVPTMGQYTMEELVKRITSFALSLVKPESIDKTKKQYSARIMKLHSLSQKNITEQDIAEDDRLAYLLNK